MPWRDVNSCYCDWRIQSGVGGWRWWCDVKTVDRWSWSMQKIECTPKADCTNVCGLWQTVISLWDVLMIFHSFWPLCDFLMRFHAFRPLSQTRLIPNSRGCGVGGEEVMQKHAWESEDEGKFSDSCVTSMHDIKSMFEDDVTWPEHALVMCDSRRFTRGFGLVANIWFWSGFFLPSPFLARWLQM
jgi:hypothetical protein